METIQFNLKISLNRNYRWKNDKAKLLIYELSIVTVLAHDQLQDKWNEFALIAENFLHANVIFVFLVLDQLVGCKKHLPDLFFQVISQSFNFAAYCVSFTHSRNPMKLQICWCNFFLYSSLILDPLLLLIAGFAFYATFHVSK